jgi:hypothetical protein
LAFLVATTTDRYAAIQVAQFNDAKGPSGPFALVFFLDHCCPLPAATLNFYHAAADIKTRLMMPCMFARSNAPSRLVQILTLSSALLLAGCDLEALLADPKIAQREADAKAIGGACRHGLRSIEDCYSLNEKASRAAIFAGWKDMDQYMRSNKIEGVAPSSSAKPSAAAPKSAEVIEESKDKDKSKPKNAIKDTVKDTTKAKN